MDEILQDISKAVAAIGRIDGVPTLLAVLCETTGMGFAAVVRVTEKIWTVCAVQDDLQLGIKTGAPFALRTNLAFETQSSRAPIIVEHTSTDPRYPPAADSRVWNAGDPIPEDRIGKIFQPFWRHSVSTSRNGLGLGLHICSQIVRAHGAKSPLHRPRRTARYSPRVCHWVRYRK
jgi:hypothetical protein